METFKFVLLTVNNTNKEIIYSLKINENVVIFMQNIISQHVKWLKSFISLIYIHISWNYN